MLIHKELKQGDTSTFTNNDLTLIQQNIHQVCAAVHHPLSQSATKTYTTLELMSYKTNNNEQFIFVNNSQLYYRFLY